MVRISLLAHKFRGEDQKKKGLRREILGSALAFARVFHSEMYFYSSWEGTSSISGGGRNTLQWYRACYFFSRHNPRLGGISRDLGGTTLKCPARGAGLVC